VEHTTYDSHWQEPELAVAGSVWDRSAPPPPPGAPSGMSLTSPLTQKKEEAAPASMATTIPVGEPYQDDVLNGDVGEEADYDDGATAENMLNEGLDAAHAAHDKQTVLAVRGDRDDDPEEETGRTPAGVDLETSGSLAWGATSQDWIPIGGSPSSDIVPAGTVVRTSVVDQSWSHVGALMTPLGSFEEVTVTGIPPGITAQARMNTSLIPPPASDAPIP
jgi:hypothetical protein